MESENLRQNDVSHIWTRLNPRWLAAGLFSGWGAGFVMLLLAGLSVPHEFFYPAKLVGATLFGPHALQRGPLGVGGMAGLIIHFGLASFFGLVFAQFVSEWSRCRILLLLGPLAGLAVWLFWSMMFMPSFNEPMFHLLPRGFSLLLHLGFGLAFGVSIVLLRSLLRITR